MAVGNKTRFPLLGLLTWGPGSGYDLKQRIEDSLGNFWSESFGQIYPVLKQLEGEGLVRSHGDDGQGRRPRTVYALTDAGQTALREWLTKPAQPQPLRLEILLKLFFGRQADARVNREHLAAVRTLHREKLARFEAKEATLRRLHPQHPDLPYWLITLDYGKRSSRAVIEWCDAALAALPAAEGDTAPDAAPLFTT